MLHNLRRTIARRDYKTSDEDGGREGYTRKAKDMLQQGMTLYSLDGRRF